MMMVGVSMIIIINTSMMYRVGFVIVVVWSLLIFGLVGLEIC